MYTSKDKFWKDEQGNEIPYARVTTLERYAEQKSAALLKQAVDINKRLVDFKASIQSACDKLYADYMATKNIAGNRKGNFTWHNFDRSVKIEVSINDRIEFDDLSIEACRLKLNEFLNKNIDAKLDYVKDMINEAFSTSRGKLDAKKVMGLLRYKSKINVPEFHEAMTLLEESIRRPDSKVYFRIWLKNAAGKYESIELNFSNI